MAAPSLAHDVTKQDEYDQVVQTTLRRFGSLDVLVNNAGVSGTSGLLMEDIEFEAWHEEGHEREP